MKLILSVILLISLTSCTTRQINNKQQTFIEYVILNKNSDYQGKNWDNQPEDNFPGLRLINWFKVDNNI